MISQVYANKLLNVMFGITDAVSLPSTLYLGLCVTEPAAYDGAVSGEPTAKGYARKEVGGSLSTVKKLFGSFLEDGITTSTSAKDGKITNIAEIQFSTVREEAGTMHYYFLSESLGGDAIAWGKLSGDITTDGIGEKTVPTFFAGELEFSIDKQAT